MFGWKKVADETQKALEAWKEVAEKQKEVAALYKQQAEIWKKNYDDAIRSLSDVHGSKSPFQE